MTFSYSYIASILRISWSCSQQLLAAKGNIHWQQCFYEKGSMLFQSISDCSHLLIKHMTNSLLDVGDGRIFSCCFPISNFKNLKSFCGPYRTLRSFEKNCPVWIYARVLLSWRICPWICRWTLQSYPAAYFLVLRVTLFESRSSSEYHWVCGRGVTCFVSKGACFSKSCLWGLILHSVFF